MGNPVAQWVKRIFTPQKNAQRKFDGAISNRLTASFAQAERSINTELRNDLDALRRRSRDLSKNSPLGRKFLKMVENNVVGPRGFVMQARVVGTQNDRSAPDNGANWALETAWAEWCKPEFCDITGRMSFADMSRAIIRGVARDGEAIVRIYEGAPNKFGFALQLLDIERLDTMLNREPSSGQNQIIMGVEMDTFGKPLAYWLRAAPHGRDALTQAQVRVPAAQIIHLFMTDDPEQVRGIPWMHASMISVHHLKGYNEAAIIAARVGASKMGFFTSPDGEPKDLADGEDEQGIPFTEAEPGQFGVIPQGYGFESFNPDYPHANYASFVKEHKRDIASGFNVAYNTLANDLEGVNFSSIRSGTLEDRENWMTVQAWMIGQLCDKIHALWLDNSLLSSAIVLENGSALPALKRDKLSAHEFQGRRWQWVDPFKDIQASVMAIENGLADPFTIIAQQGLDAETVLDGIARFQQYAASKGVKLGKPEAPAPTNDNTDNADAQDNARTLEMLHEMRGMISARDATPAAPVAPVSVSLNSDDFKAAARDVADAMVEHSRQLHAQIREDVQNMPIVIPAPEVTMEFNPQITVEQAAVTVENNVHAGEVTVTLPARRTETEIKRDSVTGEMLGSVAIERDA